MNEASFSKWLCNKLLKQGLFPQRLEVTTGAGIPDLAVLSNSLTLDKGDPYDIHPYTLWIELKWETKHIRPEQYVWGTKASKTGVNVNYLVGYDDRMELYSLQDAKPMTKTYKLTTLIKDFPRTGEGMKDLISYLQ